MKEKELEAYLHAQIPASKLLGVEVKSCSQTNIELLAPLEPNINHKNTAFGGSLSVLAILAGWSLVYMRLNGIRNEIVIQESSMTYLKPANGSFTATSLYEESTDWSKFYRSFTKRGRGRIKVKSNILCGEEIVATFQGTYVAFNKEFT
ncbi:YiiD C-terminal domain-containing protein [Vibrio sp. VB16]|uniref:YiiD C-terminal domain-containing protein n=1 Tax=Vibrio sp. VB16 TaxID=2785746 RepID=UPI00189CA8AA|nr:YiiD C-terminal domain-containing protein [Vibrio sp. VB16]UGA53567.1 thioesterase domain-containing protein [Vibrio sp. VB16]